MSGSERSWDLQAEQQQRRAEDLWRRLRRVEGRTSEGHLRREGRDWVDFCSNDYLGLAGSSFLKEQLAVAVARQGAGSGASRLVAGNFAAHEAFESRLASFKGSEAALAFSSGYAVALGGIPALVGPGDTILLDKLCHACLVDAARLSGATLRVFPHNHLAKLKRLLETAKGRVLVVTESVFSMDGDRAALKEIVELKDQHGAWLWLDEAHAVGVVGPQGRGLAAEHGLEDRVELQMGTLSKAMGLSGGYLVCSSLVREHLINSARSFIYSTAPPPAVLEAASAALDWVQGPEGDRARARLRDNVGILKTALEQPQPCFDSAIVPIVVGAAERAVALSEQLQVEGHWVPAIRYPTVARDAARLRVTLSARHEVGQIEALAMSLRNAMAELP